MQMLERKEQGTGSSYQGNEFGGGMPPSAGIDIPEDDVPF